MGGGSRTPTDSPVNTGDEAFDERKSPHVFDSKPGSTEESVTSGSEDTTTTSGSEGVTATEHSHSEGSETGTGVVDTGSQQGVSGSTGISGDLWEFGEDSAEEYAVNYDFGYDSKLAQHFKSQPTEALEEKFEAAKARIEDNPFSSFEEGQQFTSSERFIGGVLASRSDSSVKASDVAHIEWDADTVKGGQTVDEFNEMVESDLNETIELMDEYVAGKAMSTLKTIEIEDLGTNDDGTITGGSYDMVGTMKVSPRETTSASEATVTHELAHVIEESYNSISDTYNDIDGDPAEFSVERDSVSEMTFGGESLNTEVSEEFSDGLEEITRDFHNAATGENTPGMRRSMRSYQLTNSSEVFAVGFGKYREEFITMSNEQSALVEHIDTHVTGNGWKTTNMNELRTSGGIQNPNVKQSHAPPGTKEGSIGEVVKVNYETPQPDPVFPDELSDRTHVTGHVTETSEDSVTVCYQGREETIPTNKIDSVQTRTQ